jgi:hypothetical protein
MGCFMALLLLPIKPIYSSIHADWKRLDAGLFYGEFELKQKAAAKYPYPMAVLKIDPGLYRFRLLSASEHHGKPRTVKQWCKEFYLLAAINASMYKKQNQVQSTGYMKNHQHTNNASINNRFGAFMAFDPEKTDLPPVQIIDRHAQDWKNLIRHYRVVIQNYRLINLKQHNLWKPTEKIYSTAAVGVDQKGNVLFIFCRTPMSTHDFNEAILRLPLDIKNAMYVEGGPEASLYFNTESLETEWVGSFETYFLENDENHLAWAVPNVIGIVKREKQ